MVYWETAHTVPNGPHDVRDWTQQWQATEKIVYSRTLAEPRSVRTRIEREFDPDAVRRLKGDARHDITVNGPGLAAHALRAGLVDELQYRLSDLTSVHVETQHRIYRAGSRAMAPLCRIARASLCPRRTGTCRGRNPQPPSRQL